MLCMNISFILLNFFHWWNWNFNHRSMSSYPTKYKSKTIIRTCDSLASWCFLFESSYFTIKKADKHFKLFCKTLQNLIKTSCIKTYLSWSGLNKIDITSARETLKLSEAQHDGSATGNGISLLKKGFLKKLSCTKHVGICRDIHLMNCHHPRETKARMLLTGSWW